MAHIRLRNAERCSRSGACIRDWFGLGSGICFNLMIHLWSWHWIHGTFTFFALYIYRRIGILPRIVLYLTSFLNFVTKPHKVLEFIKLHQPYPSSLDLRTFPHFTVSRVFLRSHHLISTPLSRFLHVPKYRRMSLHRLCGPPCRAPPSAPRNARTHSRFLTLR